MSGYIETIGEVRLEQTFNAIQVLENQLVACVELDAWLPVNALRVEF